MNTTFTADLLSFPRLRMGCLLLLVGWSIPGIACRSLAEESPKPAETSAKGYQLAWSDEFNDDGPLDSKKWNYERGFVRNEELQWYQPENASCSGGCLVIEGRRERVANPDYQPGSRNWRRNREYAEYTSACVTTRKRQNWTHGRFVIRARFDADSGLWPAIWTLGARGGWPAGGEIDIMEYYAGDLLANVCWLGENRQPAWDSSQRPIAKLGSDWNRQFHVWQLDWTAESIEISVDGKSLNKTSLDKAVNADRRRSEPFQKPQYLLLNLAIGGSQGGDPTGTKFPAKFEVDYVRVFQRSDKAN